MTSLVELRDEYMAAERRMAEADAAWRRDNLTSAAYMAAMDDVDRAKAALAAAVIGARR